ncbi:MAG: uroporphyrinogen decarboxylase family protein [Thermoproteota archaeon]
MNSWERVVRAMQLSVPDRVPIYEMHIPPKISSVILGKSVDEVMLHNPEAFYNLVISKKEINLDKVNEQVANELLSLYKKLGIDWIRVVGAYTSIPREVRKLEEHTWQIDGRRYKWSGDSMWDLDEPKTYDPDEVIRACKNAKVEVNPKVFDVLRRLVKEVKKEMFLSFDADGTWGPIVSYPNLLKHVLIWVYKRPDAVEALINYHTNIAIEYGKYAIDEGADAIQLCVDYGNQNGPWMSPAMFRRFVKPALERHANAFKKKGAFVVLHSDGYIMPLLKDVVDAGINAYQGIDAIAGMSLRKVKEEFGSKICLVGNVDPRVIEFGTKEDVEREVDRCLREGGKEGYVLSASANISVNTNAENFVHMINYAKQKGVYS